MARLLQLLQGSSNNADMAAWTAVIFASITALVIWGLLNAYQTCSRNQELTVRILLINIQTQGGSEITDGVLTIRQEFC